MHFIERIEDLDLEKEKKKVSTKKYLPNFFFVEQIDGRPKRKKRGKYEKINTCFFVGQIDKDKEKVSTKE